MAACRESLPLAESPDVVRARQRVRERAVAIGFSIVEQTKLVTAASEIARNTMTYGGGGEMHIEDDLKDGRPGLRLTFVDDGPGIADLELALTDGWTSGGGLGMGLSGARRLVEHFAVESAPGSGTTVTLIRWR